MKDTYATGFAFSPDGRKLLIGWEGDRLTKTSTAIYDLDTANLVQSFQHPVPANHARSVEWLPDGKTVKNGQRLLDVESQSERAAFGVFHEWSDDGQRYMATGLSDGRPVVHRLPESGGKAETLLTVVDYQSPTERHLIWSPDGDSLTTVLGDRQTLVVPWRDGASLANSRTFPERVHSWSPDGKMAVAGVDSLRNVWSWGERRQLHAPKLAFKDPSSHAWSPDSGKLAYGSQARLIQLLDVTTGELREPWLLSGPSNLSVYRIAWSPEGKRLAAFCDKPQSLFVLSTEDGSVIAKSGSFNHAGLRKLVWTADSQRILLGGDRVLLEFDAKTGHLNREFDVGVSQNAFVFLKDSTVQLATPGGEVLKLNLTTGAKEPVAQVAGTSVEFSHDLKYVACDLANVRHIIRLSDRQTVVTLPAPSTLISPEGHVWTLNAPKGSLWHTSPDIAGRFVFIVQTPDGQQTLTPNDFASRYGWQNDPSQVRLK